MTVMLLSLLVLLAGADALPVTTVTFQRQDIDTPSWTEDSASVAIKKQR